MIKVAVIDDNLQYRTTISIILQLDEKLKLIHKLENCERIVAYFEAECPDVVLMDINMPGLSGIEGVWLLRKHWPDMRILMLTVFEDDEKIFGAIKAGANGYLLKKDTPQKILEAVGSVYQGESPMNGLIAAKVLEYFQKRRKNFHDLESFGLTEREKEVLGLLVEGNSYKHISSRMFISVETLNSHIKNVYRKLNVHSRSELAARFWKGME